MTENDVGDVRATERGQAIDEAYGRNDIDPMPRSEFVRSTWVVKGKLC